MPGTPGNTAPPAATSKPSSAHGVPIAVSEVAPGHLHDLTVARDTGTIAPR